MRICGIDPGFSGGISLFEDKKCLECMPMPIYENANGKKQIDGRKLSVYFTEKQISGIIIEQVHSMPHQGIASAFNFGRGVGKILGVAEALHKDIIEVSPQKWKNVILGEQYDHTTKEGSIKYCQDNFPHINLLATKRSKVPHDGMADAICIGIYSFYAEV